MYRKNLIIAGLLILPFFAGLLDSASNGHRSLASSPSHLPAEVKALASEAPIEDMGLTPKIVTRYRQYLRDVPVFVVNQGTQSVTFYNDMDLEHVLSDVIVARTDRSGIYVRHDAEKRLGKLLENDRFRQLLGKNGIDSISLSGKDLLAGAAARAHLSLSRHPNGQAAFFAVLKHRLRQKIPARGRSSTARSDAESGAGDASL
jgi:hypothetical protein